MSVTANEIYNSIIESGVADSPAAKLCIEQAVETFTSRRFRADEFMIELQSESEWTAAALEKIRDALTKFEGKTVFSVTGRSYIAERIKTSILNDNFRWGLTAEQKEAIINDESMIRRWANEYSEKDGFAYLMDYVVDDEIFEWKLAHPAKSSLDEIVSSAAQRADSSGMPYIFFLIGHEDGTWTAAAKQVEQVELTGATAYINDTEKQIIVAGPDSGTIFTRWPVDLSNYLAAGEHRERENYPMLPVHRSPDIPFVGEQDYPAEVYYRRTDINGSGIVESEFCKDREDLLSLLNWCGEAGFSVLSLWAFHVDKADDKIIDLFNAGFERRMKIILEDNDLREALWDDMQLHEDIPWQKCIGLAVTAQPPADTHDADIRVEPEPANPGNPYVDVFQDGKIIYMIGESVTIEGFDPKTEIVSMFNRQENQRFDISLSQYQRDFGRSWSIPEQEKSKLDSVIKNAETRAGQAPNLKNNIHKDDRDQIPF